MIRRHSTRLSQANGGEPEDEDQGGQQRTAASDYPEMGTVLTDRPDPGAVITVIGTRHQADAYGTEDDARNQEYNGGTQDLGMYWAEPGQQAWKEEHLGPQEEAPPPLYDPDMSPVMARLAQIEEAGALIGARHCATTINGTQVDDAGDAPAHGTVPRATDPDGYDARSTEGQGDDKWSQALPWGSKKDENAATVGMYPEGMSAGGGPGLEVGAFTAAMSRQEFGELRRHMLEHHDFSDQDPDYGDPKSLAETHASHHDMGVGGHGHGPEYEFNPWWDEAEGTGGYHEFTSLRRTARVPWTDKERGRLHRWQQAPTATWGDFVPSTEFPALKPGEHVSHEEPEDDGLGPVEAVSDRQWEHHLLGAHGWGSRQVENALARDDSLRGVHEALHGAGLADHQHQAGPEQGREEARERSLGNMFGPDITTGGPRMTSPAGYPLAGPERGGASGEDPMLGIIRSKEGRPPVHPDYWEQADPARFRRMMSALNVHVRVDGKEVHGHDDDEDGPDPQPHEHDDAGDNLDSDEDNQLDSDEDNQSAKNGLDNEFPQVSKGTQQDRTQDKALVNPVDPDDPMNDPGNWPQAGADVSERDRAYTQGSGDAKVTRGDPAGPGGGPRGEDDQDDGDDDDSLPFSKDGALAMFTASAASPAFRFEFTAAWSDVVAKARRIRAEGHVRIVHASAGMVIGEVRGDHDTYESGIQRPVGKRQAIQHWACGCPWASFHQKTAGRSFSGRPCSHVMALQFEAQARGMFGRQFSSDAEVPGWSPPSVVVKSWPPYEGEPHAGRWREEWRAPLARRHAGAVPWSALRHPGAPAQRATAVLVRAREDPEEIGALRLLAGLPDPGLRIACMGNSIAANGNSSEDDDAGLSFLRWASLLSGGRIRHAGSFSAGGASSSQILASQLATVVAARPDACVIGPWAVNNPVLGVSFERTAADTENAVLALRVAGIAPLISLEPPAADPVRSAFVRRYNAWAQRFAARSGVPVADFFTALSDRDGAWAGGYSADGIHPTAAGARVMGQAVAGLLSVVAMRATADQANAPWGSDNVAQHPPQKPYGATSPPNKDQDPGSYGPLAAPDPENWGGIQEDSAYQMPIGNTASAHQVLVPGAPRPQPGDLHWPDVNGWQAEDQGTFGYTDHSNTAGPSTAMNARDPNGIRMEEMIRQAAGTPFPYHGTVPQLDGALAELRDEPEPALPETTGDDDTEHTAAADGTIGGGSAGTGEGQGAALDTAALGEFGASVRARFRQMTGGTPMGDLGRETSPQAQVPSPAGQEPGMGSGDDALGPEDPSIQTVGNQQWSGGGADSDEVAVPAGQPQGGIEDIVASFQRSAGAKGLQPGSPARPDGDIAVSARQYLAKTAEALPQAEADELIREGAGSRARNLDLLRLEGTHYEDEDEELGKKGVSMDDYDDDVIFA